MRNRFLAEEVWENVGLDREECTKYVQDSEMMQTFRKMLFSRIVPTIKDLGLWGPKVQAAFEDMGVIDYQDLSPEDLSAADEQIALDLDRDRGGADGEREAMVSLAGIDPDRAAEVEAAIQAGAED